MNEREEQLFPVTSGVFDLAESGSSPDRYKWLKFRYRWFKFYYRHYGLDFKRLRSDILEYALHCTEGGIHDSFGHLFALYAWRTWQWYCQDRCLCANDNVVFGGVLAVKYQSDMDEYGRVYDETHRYRDTAVYPTIKWHPFATLRKGTRVPRFGRIFDMDMMENVYRRGLQ